MFLRTYRRSPQRRLLRLLILFLSAAFFLDVLTILQQYREFSRNLLSHTYTELSMLPTPAQHQRIYICAQFWTSAAVIEEHWGAALLDLIATLGVENVYVSIYESGSLDNTKDVLQYLEQMLAERNVRRTVVLDPTTHADEINAGPLDEQGNPRSGWIQTTSAYSGKEMRRIPYLARLRNLSLKPLLDEQSKGRTYDKILFLNDVFFTPSDVLTLLATNQGSYAAACALDFHYPPAYYDTFALRDSNGSSTIMTKFPYFRSEDSRKAILQGKATKVRSCWNGMILMDTAAFYDGLRFRAISDSLASKHMEGSECCLIHADLSAMGAATKGIYVNPAVRVGYTTRAYNLTHSGPEKNFVSLARYLTGVWTNRAYRTVSNEASDTKIVRSKVERWKKEGVNSLEKRDERGLMCLIDEMHILIWNG